jgi:FKBP-type peptidyl-prolyl cis-trans isomerase
MRLSIGPTAFLSLVFSALMGLLAFSACQPGTGQASLDSEDQMASYGIGLQIGGQLSPADTHLDQQALMAGIRDAMAGNESAVPQEELQTAMQAFNTKIREEETARRAAAAEENAAAGAAFLEENAQKEGVQVTESGLQYEVLREGDGASPGPTDRVSIHYRGTLIDGTQFDSSYDRGEPATFGVSGVIPGFSEGLQLMTVGSQYRFFIPSDLGYGPQGSGQTIGPNATLIFEVEMLDIVE